MLPLRSRSVTRIVSASAERVSASSEAAERGSASSCAASLAPRLRLPAVLAAVTQQQRTQQRVERREKGRHLHTFVGRPDGRFYQFHALRPRPSLLLAGAMDAVVLGARELSAASSDIALSHEALLLLLPLLPLDCRARAACVCRAWRAATAHPALWEALSFECCTARVTNAALSSLCACAGAALLTLRLDANVCADVTPDGMLAALRGGVCTGVQRLHAPYISVDKTMNFFGRVLTAGMAQELVAMCPMLQYSEFSVRIKLSDAVAVLGLLPGPLTLRCARNNDIYDESDLSRLAAFLHVNAALKSLTLHKYCIGVSGVTQLATCLNVNAVLKSLSLTESGIGSAEAAQLAGFLRENATLTSLNLLNNNIGDEGTVQLAECLRVNTTLSGLCLRLNGIGVAGATQLADCLRVNVTLTRLQLGGNVAIGYVGATQLAGCLHANATLKYLDLSSCRIGDVGAYRLVECLRVNSTLTGLDLWYNGISKFGTAELLRCLDANTTLMSLDLRSNDLDDSDLSWLWERLLANAALAAQRGLQTWGTSCASQLIGMGARE